MDKTWTLLNVDVMLGRAAGNGTANSFLPSVGKKAAHYDSLGLHWEHVSSRVLET